MFPRTSLFLILLQYLLCNFIFNIFNFSILLSCFSIIFYWLLLLILSNYQWVSFFSFHIQPLPKIWKLFLEIIFTRICLHKAKISQVSKAIWWKMIVIVKVIDILMHLQIPLTAFFVRLLLLINVSFFGQRENKLDFGGLYLPCFRSTKHFLNMLHGFNILFLILGFVFQRSIFK